MVSLATGIKVVVVIAVAWFMIFLLLLSGMIGGSNVQPPTRLPTLKDLAAGRQHGVTGTTTSTQVERVYVTATVTVTATLPPPIPVVRPVQDVTTRLPQQSQPPRETGVVTPPPVQQQSGSDTVEREAAQRAIVVPARRTVDRTNEKPKGKFDFLLTPDHAPTKISLPPGTLWPRISPRWENVGAVVLTYNRPHYLRKTLDSMTKLELANEVKIYVSQDGFDVPTANVAKEYKDVEFMQRDRTLHGNVANSGTAHLAQHYKSALDRVFAKGHELVIIAEDDMIFSPDFFWYFKQTAILLDDDPTIYCVSSWNDNGFAAHAQDNKRLFRTGFFPGLGWMLTKELWEELSPIWPLDHWDWWMRTSPIHKGRECVTAEISRNYNIGVEGANMHKGDYDRGLKNIVHNNEWVDLGNLEYLFLPNYKQYVQGLVSSGTVVPHGEAITWRGDPTAIAASIQRHGGDSSAAHPVVVVPYKHEQWGSLSSSLSLFNHPRAYHLFTNILPQNKYIVILADLRKSPYLAPTGLLQTPQPSLEAVPGVKAKSCDETCANRDMRCAADQFDYVNTCEQLADKFPCENGCKYVVGPDIPNYVDLPSDKQHRMCLVTEEESTCRASHRATLRLCPCVGR